MTHHVRLIRNRAALLAGIGALLLLAMVTTPGTGATTLTRPWTIDASPNPSTSLASQLNAVSCAGPGNCVAVGLTVPASRDQLALIERLSGGSWSIASNPAIAGATDSPLDAVSCPTAAFCVAVGYARYAAPHVPYVALAETWNGASWNLDSLPVPVNAQEPTFDGVSCSTRGQCVAVGDYIDSVTDQYRPLAERLDGGTWSVIPAPTPRGANGNSNFTAIDCRLITSCEVVGIVSYNDTLQSVVAYGLDGSTWSKQIPVNPGPDPGNTDSAVSCSAVAACTSVGSVDVIGSDALVEYWNGTTWVRQSTTSPVGRPENSLSGVSCAGNAFCVAVGMASHTTTSAHHPMAEVWNGATWVQAPPAGVVGRTVNLPAVSCLSPTSCIAVGWSSTSSSEYTLIESYAG
jgi:hypothetical protein